MQTTEQVTEYKIGRAIVRMHGTPDREKVEAAAIRFLQRVQQSKRQAQKEAKR